MQNVKIEDKEHYIPLTELIKKRWLMNRVME